jgi:hypothetical protein
MFKCTKAKRPTERWQGLMNGHSIYRQIRLVKERNVRMENLMHKSIGAASELSPDNTSVNVNGTIEIVEELTYEQLKTAHELDRGMISSAYRDFYKITNILLEITHAPLGTYSEEEIIERINKAADIIIGQGWVF